MSKRTAKYNIPNPTQQNPFALSYGLVSKGVFALALPTTRIYRDSAGTVREAVETESAGPNAPVAMVSADMDTNGNPVPTYKEHTYTYYGAGQVHSDTVTDGVNTWVKTFMYENGQQVRDSGWVKQ